MQIVKKSDRREHESPEFYDFQACVLEGRDPFAPGYARFVVIFKKPQSRGQSIPERMRDGCDQHPVFLQHRYGFFQCGSGILQMLQDRQGRDEIVRFAFNGIRQLGDVSEYDSNSPRISGKVSGMRREIGRILYARKSRAGGQIPEHFQYCRALRRTQIKRAQ